MAQFPPKRKRRGVILSTLGWQRLQEAQESLAMTQNGGYAYTLEQLSNLTGLSVRSITRLQSCKVAVDRQTLEEFFRAFNLTLTNQDYFQPDVQSREIEVDTFIPLSAQDWGDAPDVSMFYGRIAELDTLTQWILEDRCRLIGIIGIGGVGKTTLSVKLTEQVQGHFTHIIWRSLRNAPRLEALLAELVPYLSAQQETQADLNSFLQCLRRHRCLVVLDNLESLLDSGSRSGQYRPGCEAYGDLMRVVVESRHQSCVLVTSREKCAQSAQWEGNPAVQRLVLSGSPEASKELLEATALIGTDVQKQALCDRYRCNLLALKIVVTTIRDLFAGNIGLFLEQNVTLFGDIFDLIHQQYSRLSTLEKQVMLWLAIDREWVSFAQLQEDLKGRVSPLQLMDALRLLEGRSLLEANAGQFTLQPVVMEYVTETLINQAYDEITDQSSTPWSSNCFLQTHALTKAQDKDYIRDSQIRVIVLPLITRLLNHFESYKEIVYQLQQITHRLQTECPNQAGYAGGNIVNLLRHLQVDLSGYDLSYLSIWQADFQNMALHRVNFAHSDLSKSKFNYPSGSILAVAFSLDNQLLATGDHNHVVGVWQVSDGKPKATLRGHIGWVWAVAWSPDGQSLVSGGEDQTVRLWNLATGTCVATLSGHQGTIRTLAWQPHGRLFASAGDDHGIRLWDGQPQTESRILQGHDNCVMSIAWSPDGQRLASSSLDQTIRLWDVQSGKCLKVLSGHSNGIWAIAWSPNGKFLATGSDDQSVKIWDAQEGDCMTTLQRNPSSIFAVAWSPNSTLLASGGEDQSITIWDIGSDRCLRVLQGHNGIICSLAWSTDENLLASGSRDQTVRLWELCSSQTHHCRSIKTFQGYNNSVFAVAWSPDGHTLASSNGDRLIHLWKLDATPRSEEVEGDTTAIGRAAWEVDGTIPDHASAYRSVQLSCCLAWHPNSSLLASPADDYTVRLWSPNTRECLTTLRGHQSWVFAIAWSPDGQILASGGSDLGIQLWDVDQERSVQILQGHRNWIWSLDWRPDGTLLASASDDCTIRLWSPSTGKCVQVLQGHDYCVESIGWSPDGNHLASGSHDRTIRLWDSSTGKCLNTLQGHRDVIRRVAWSPDSRTLASCSRDQTIRLWDSRTGKCIHVLEGHTGQVWSVAWCPTDGLEHSSYLLASSSDDETIRLWDGGTGKCVKTLKADRLYEGMNITRTTGITEEQKATLRALGATSD